MFLFFRQTTELSKKRVEYNERQKHIENLNRAIIKSGINFDELNQIIFLVQVLAKDKDKTRKNIKLAKGFYLRYVNGYLILDINFNN